jgi:hypothetical protein
MSFGADANVKDSLEKTPLDLAVENRFSLCARILILDYKAEYNIESVLLLQATITINFISLVI